MSGLTVQITPDGPFEALRTLRARNDEDAVNRYDVTLDAETGFVQRIVRVRSLEVIVDRRTRWATDVVRIPGPREVTLHDSAAPSETSGRAFGAVKRALAQPKRVDWGSRSESGFMAANPFVGIFADLDRAKRSGSYLHDDGGVLALAPEGCEHPLSITPRLWRRYFFPRQLSGPSSLRFCRVRGGYALLSTMGTPWRDFVAARFDGTTDMSLINARLRALREERAGDIF